MYQLVDLAILAGHKVKIKEGEKTQEISEPCQIVKIVVEYECDININHSWSKWNNFQEPRKENKRIRILRKN